MTNKRKLRYTYVVFLKVIMLHYLLLFSSFHLMSPTNAFYTDNDNGQFGFSAAADFGRWDNSSLEIAVNGIDRHEISIIVTNVGDGNMVRPVDYYVYFRPDTSARDGNQIRSGAIQVGSGSVGPLDNNGSNQSEIVSYTPSEAGYYVFEVDRPEGHPAEGPILSDNINLSSCQSVTDDVYGDGNSGENGEITFDDEVEGKPVEDSPVDVEEGRIEDDNSEYNKEENTEDTEEETDESETVTEDVYGGGN